MAAAMGIELLTEGDTDHRVSDADRGDIGSSDPA